MLSLDNVVEAFRANFLWALAVNIPIAIVSYGLKAVRGSGLIIGLVYGIVICSFAGPPAFFILLSFFLAGSIVSRVRPDYRKGKDGEEDRKGRGAASVVGKCTLGAGMAVLIGAGGEGVAASADHESRGVLLWLWLGYAGAFSAALADTFASELGPLPGGKAITLPTAESVPHGTPGAVSLGGTFFGVVGATLMALLAVLLGVIHEKALLFIIFSSLVAILVESYLRARWPGGRFLAKQAANFFVTLIGALGSVLLGLALGY
jgi:uncharacterized protein (TIGR00297 family)